uniref:Uncharacterized protein n=1 Tax=Strigamia maritima TaxID=126957 RepID=T1J6K1_STRMM
MVVVFFEDPPPPFNLILRKEKKLCFRPIDVSSARAWQRSSSAWFLGVGSRSSRALASGRAFNSPVVTHVFEVNPVRVCGFAFLSGLILATAKFIDKPQLIGQGLTCHSPLIKRARPGEGIGIRAIHQGAFCLKAINRRLLLLSLPPPPRGCFRLSLDSLSSLELKKAICCHLPSPPQPPDGRPCTECARALACMSPRGTNCFFYSVSMTTSCSARSECAQTRTSFVRSSYLLLTSDTKEVTKGGKCDEMVPMVHNTLHSAGGTSDDTRTEDEINEVNGPPRSDSRERLSDDVSSHTSSGRGYIGIARQFYALPLSRP